MWALLESFRFPYSHSTASSARSFLGIAESGLAPALGKLNRIPPDIVKILRTQKHFTLARGIVMMSKRVR
jgi:hypothetical protein